MPANIHVYLTDEVISHAMPPDRGEIRLWDTEFKGFLVRVWPSGRKSFCVRYRRTRTPELYTIGTFGSPWTTQSARARGSDIILRYADSHKPARDRKLGHAMTISELCDRYLTEGPLMKVGKRASSWSLDVGNLKHHVQPLIGKRIVADLKRSDFAHMVRDITDGVTAGDFRTKKQGMAHVRGGENCAARALSTVRTMLNWAIAQDLLTDNPTKGISLPKQPLRERFLSDEEAKQLFATLDAGVQDHSVNPQHADLIRLLLLTGARKTELMGLRWDEVETARKPQDPARSRNKAGVRLDAKGRQVATRPAPQQRGIRRPRPLRAALPAPGSTGQFQESRTLCPRCQNSEPGPIIP